MQVAPSAAAYAPAPGDLASQPAPGSTPGFTDQPQDNASTALFAPTDNAPSTTLAQMVQAPTKPLLLTPESAAGLGIDLVQTKPLVVTPENAAGLNLPLPADNTAPAAAPSASPTEIAALELLLAEPANQDIIAQFGPPLRPLNTDTDVGQGILARFGPDLGARLTQLQEAHNAVRGQFLQALDQAQQNPGPDVAGSELIARRSSGGDAEHITEQTLYSVTHPPSASQASDLQAIEAQAFTAGGQPQNLWRLSDPAEFAKAYANGDSPAQKAFAQLHGKEPLQFHAAVRTGETDAGPQITPAYYSLGENQLVLGGPTVTENGNPGPWAASTWQATQLTPEQNRDLINKEYLWFDPVNGWSTDLANNIRQSSNFLDKALPMVFAGVMTFATAGAFGITAASASTSLGQTMALGAISSATLQLTTGGKIDLGELLRSALTAGVSFGVMNATGMNELLQGGDLATRSLGHLGKAGLQGLLQEATGGKFKDGLTNSLLASVAGEVGKSLEGQIAELSKNEGLSVQEVSMLRLIGRAASSAVRVAGSNDPAAGFAGEFLGSVLGDGLQGAQEQSQSQNSSQAEQQGDRPSSDWVTNLGPSEVDAQGLGLRPGLGGLGVRVSDEGLSGWSDEIDGGIVLNGSMAPDAQAVTEAVVGTGQGPLAALAAAGLDAQQQRAAYGQLLASGQIQLNAQGVPIVQPGQVLQFDLSDTSAAQWGGRAIEHESAGRAQREAQAAQQAAETYTVGAGGGRGFVHPALASEHGRYPFAGRSTITDPNTYIDPRQRTMALADMSNVPADKYSAEEWRAAAQEYKQIRGKDFSRDTIYNGLWTKAAQLDAAAGKGWSRDVINDITGFATSEGLHAQAGVAIGGALGRGIGNRLGGSVDNVVAGAESRPSGGAAVQTLGATREQAVADAVGGVRSGEIIKTTRGKTDVDVTDPAGNLIAVGGPAKADNLGNFVRGLMVYSETATARGVSAYFYYAPNTPHTVIDAATKVLGPGFVKPIP